MALIDTVYKTFLLVSTYAETYRAWKRRRNSATLRSVQDERFLRVVRHAYRETDYYRGAFDDIGLRPEDIAGVADIWKLPILTKEDVQKHFSSLISRRTGPTKLEQSSGSSGRPTTVLIDRRSKVYVSAAVTRNNVANGLRFFGERFLRCLGGGQSDRLHHARGWFQGIYKTATVHVNAIGKENIRLLDAIVRWEPTVLWGPPFALAHLADACETFGRRLRPKLIIVINSPCGTFEKAIREAFHARIVQSYGSFEVGEIGAECPFHTGFHLNIDNLVVEIVRNGNPVPPGNEGNIVVTLLTSMAMPLLRYDLGDIGIVGDGPCPCGSGLPLLVRLIGREAEHLTLPDGKVISPSTFFGSIGQKGIMNSPIFDKYQVKQVGANHVRILFVESASFSQSIFESVKIDVRQVLGNECIVDFISVTDIPLGSGGKYHFIRNEFAATGREDQ